MSKRKRASLGKTPGTPPSSSEGDEANDDASVRENMVHVAPDLLADSPDIFAGKKAETGEAPEDRKSTRLNSSHSQISYAVFCLKKKKKTGAQCHYRCDRWHEPHGGRHTQARKRRC